MKVFYAALALFLCFASGANAAETQAVTTAAPGALVSGHVVVAIGAHSVGDGSKTLPSGAIVGTTDAQILAAKNVLAVPHANVTSSITLDGTARYWPCDATAGDVVLTVPAGSAFANQIFDVQKIDGTTHKCTITMTGGETLSLPGIGSVSSLDIVGQWDDLTFKNISGGMSWRAQ